MNQKHHCKLYSPYGAYGDAIEHCVEDEDGKFWSGNDEYESQVNYCPVCGAKAPKQVEEKK